MKIGNRDTEKGDIPVHNTEKWIMDGQNMEK